MARIRSIKPEFWSDPDLCQHPAEVRLFFIGLWNFADDYGVLKDDPARLRLQVMPTDPVDPYAMVDQLAASGHLLRRSAEDGTPVLVIRTFEANQRIDRRATGRWGHPSTFTDGAPPNPTDPTPPAPPIPTTPADTPPIPRVANPGREGKGRDRKNPSGSFAPAVRKVDTLFEAVAATCGIDTTALTKSSRGALNRAVGDLRAIDADPDEVPIRAGRYRTVFDGAALTPTALAKHWPALAADVPPRRRTQADRNDAARRTLLDGLGAHSGPRPATGTLGP
jgi:hypothetical protein